MQMDLGMRLKKFLHPRCLMGRKIVGDDMDFLFRGLLRDEISQKGNKLLAGMAISGFAQDFPGAGLESRIQRKRAVSMVFESMPLNPSRRQWQHLLGTIQRFN